MLQTEDLSEALKTLRIAGVFDEYVLHTAIADLFDGRGIPYVKEASLGRYARVDFLVDNRFAIEVKHTRPPRQTLLRQLKRYADSDTVQEVFLVTERSVNLPGSINGKPLHIIVLNRLWGVAL